MNNYETIFIMNANISDEERIETLDKIKSYITSNGKITNVEDLGIKKLAYKINLQSQGYYYLINFEMKPDDILGLERLYRIKEQILKFITLKQN